MLFHLFFATTIAAAAEKTEVQINICDSAAISIEKLVTSDWKKNSTERVMFVEDKNLQLYKNAWVLKIAESTEDGSLAVVLKNNQSDPNINNGDAKCEYDLHGTSKKYACKITNPITREHFEIVKKSHDYYSLLNSSQMEWLGQNNIKLPENSELTTVFKEHDETIKIDGTKYVLGLSIGASGTEYVELSARDSTENEIKLQTQLLKFLKDKKVQICENQNSIHTRMKLESFFNNKKQQGEN